MPAKCKTKPTQYQFESSPTSSLNHRSKSGVWNDKTYQHDKKFCNESFVHAPIDTCGIFGRWLRHKLLDGILVGTPVIVTIQKHRTPLRTTFMKILSFLGTEDFYTVLFLCFLWLFDPRLGRLFGVLMWLGFYTTGVLKTIFCLPRPPCPPVVPLEKAFDWALPSHHSLLGVILPWYIWLYTTLHYELSTINMSIVCFLIVLWSFGVMLSRMYLGVHSPADIVCGGVVGVIVLSLWIQVDDVVELYISQQRLEPQLKLIAAMFFLLCIHPITEPGNPSFLDTCVLHGVFSGIILARSQRSRILGMPALLQTADDLSWGNFMVLALLRVILGGTVITVMRITLKHIFTFTFEHIYSFLGLRTFSSSQYRKEMPPNPKHYTKDFKIPPISENEEKLDGNDSNETSSSDNSDVAIEDAIGTNTYMPPKWFNFIQICNSISSLLKKSNDEAWDVNVPVKLIVYTIISYSAVELVPQLFLSIGI